MNENVMEQLTIIQKMMAASLRHQGLMQWIDCYAVGQNDGGVYVSLFSKSAKFRICAVYVNRYGTDQVSQSFKKLPSFIDLSMNAGSISTDREHCAKKNWLVDCPGFMITRYQISGGTDDHEKWRFGDVLFVSGQASAPPAQSAQPNTPPASESLDSGAQSQPRAKPAQQPARPSAPTNANKERASSVQKHRIDRLTTHLFGDNWSGMTDEWIKRLTTGATHRVHEITPDEADQLIAGLEYLLVAQTFYGPQANEMVAKQLAAVARADNSEYQLACDLPISRSKQLTAGIKDSCSGESVEEAEKKIRALMGQLAPAA